MLKEAFDKIALHVAQKILTSDRYNWKVTDHIIYVDEEIPDVVLPVNTTDEDEQSPTPVYRTKYMCFKSYSNTAVYIPMDKIDAFKSLAGIYGARYKFINVSNITKHKLLHDASAYIARKVSPPAVKIKLVTCAKIEGIKIFVINVIDLDQSEELYKDLVSYKIMNERYKIE